MCIRENVPSVSRITLFCRVSTNFSTIPLIIDNRKKKRTVISCNESLSVDSVRLMVKSYGVFTAIYYLTDV